MGSGALAGRAVPLRASKGVAFKCSDRHHPDKGACEVKDMLTSFTCVNIWNAHESDQTIAVQAAHRGKTKRVLTQTYAPVKLS